MYQRLPGQVPRILISEFLDVRDPVTVYDPTFFYTSVAWLHFQWIPINMCSSFKVVPPFENAKLVRL